MSILICFTMIKNNTIADRPTDWPTSGSIVLNAHEQHATTVTASHTEMEMAIDNHKSSSIKISLIFGFWCEKSNVCCCARDRTNEPSQHSSIVLCATDRENVFVATRAKEEDRKREKKHSSEWIFWWRSNACWQTAHLFLHSLSTSSVVIFFSTIFSPLVCTQRKRFSHGMWHFWISIFFPTWFVPGVTQ